MESGLLCEETYLINRMRAGDTQAFLPLLEPHMAAMKAMIRSIANDPADVEDAMQECLLKVLSHIDQFHPGQSFRAWLRQIATHEALKLVRWRRRHPQVAIEASSEDDDVTFDMVDPAGSPEAALEAKELEDAFHQAINTLTGMYQKVFTLHQLEELTTTEVAARLGIRTETAHTRLHRARVSLYWYLHAMSFAACGNSRHLTGSCPHQRHGRIHLA
jgi:RNA polymerase sigma-70 factor (ECF subfamily)